MNRLAARSMERGDQEGARYYHGVVERLAEYMKRLLTDVVDTAEVERVGMPLAGESFSVREVQEECHAYSRSLVRDQELSLAWSGEISGSYRGDGERIKLAFSELWRTPFGTTGSEETSGCGQKNNRVLEPAIILPSVWRTAAEA